MASEEFLLRARGLSLIAREAHIYIQVHHMYIYSHIEIYAHSHIYTDMHTHTPMCTYVHTIHINTHLYMYFIHIKGK